jgi:hypothetical protein
MKVKEYTIEEQGAHNREFVNLQVQTLISKLFKSNLNILDEIKTEGSVSEDVAKDARKKILDSGNDTIREIHNLLDVFDFYINPNRLKEATKHKKVIKKVTVSGHYQVREKHE